MSSATHLLVQECPRNVVDETLGAEDSPKSFFVVLAEYLHRVRMREMLPILKSKSGQRFVEYTCVRYVYSDWAVFSFELA